MKRIIEYIAEESNPPITIAELLRARGYSNNLITTLRRTDGAVTMAGETVFSNHLLKTGEVVQITLDEEGSENIVPSLIPLDIIFEDRDILILNKPSSLPVHPSQGCYDHTLANGVVHYYREKGESIVFRAVNRLDRDTTGLILIAKNRLSSAILSTLMKEGGIHREYLAIVSGTPPDSGCIDAPIGRLPGSILERCIDQTAGASAITYYKKLSTRNGCSLLSLRLETGRTHQIRVHMKHLGYPLLGDFLYNPDYSKIMRQSLHSHKLAFEHPITRKPLCFTAFLPDDMRCLLAK